MNKLSNCCEKEPTYQTLFPDEICQSAVSELCAWTSVHDIAAAARYLAKKPNPDDQFDSKLLIPYPADDVLERIAIEVIRWLIEIFHVAEPKISLAQLIEPSLTEERGKLIASVSFQPSIASGDANMFVNYFPVLNNSLGSRFFLVEDEPHVIELIQGPMRAMMGVILSTYETASSMKKVAFSTAITGKSPEIFHRPYADSRMRAVIEALAFYACGLSIGPKWAEEQKIEIDFSYKSVNICGAPPFDEKMLKKAHELTGEMLDHLR